MRFNKTRWIPKDSIPVEHPDGLGIAYVYRCGRGYGVIAYGGKRNTSDSHYSYKTIEQAHEAIENWFARLAEHKQRVLDYRKASYAPHTFKPGDIVTNSWGYDQTNVDWYRVTSVTDHFVWLQPICGHTEETGFMSGHSTPHVDTSSADPSTWGFKDAKAEPVRHRASGSSVCMKYGSGSKWDGRAMYESWYA